MISRRCLLSAVPAGFAAANIAGEAHADTLSPAQTTAIAEEAFIYGFPLVMNYGVMYEYFIDQTAAAYKAPLNQLYNTTRVYTLQDTTIVTPNSDTPYSFVGLDLRAEPFVLCSPDREGPVFLGATRRHVHRQFRLRRQPHDRKRCRMFHDRRTPLDR